MKLPKTLRVFSRTYKVLTFNDRADVDREQEIPLFSQGDNRRSEIRIHSGKRSIEAQWGDVWDNLLWICGGVLVFPNINHPVVGTMISAVCFDNELTFAKIPKVVRIIGQPYTISWTVQSRVDETGNKAADARISYALSQIRLPIKLGYPVNAQWRDLWHEIVHGIFSAIEDKTGKDEGFVDRLATSINTICYDNKLDFSRAKKNA